MRSAESLNASPVTFCTTRTERSSAGKHNATPAKRGTRKPRIRLTNDIGAPPRYRSRLVMRRYDIVEGTRESSAPLTRSS